MNRDGKKRAKKNVTGKIHNLNFAVFYTLVTLKYGVCLAVRLPNK